MVSTPPWFISSAYTPGCDDGWSIKDNDRSYLEFVSDLQDRLETAYHDVR